jgi:tetratricopeptide (TPR) repeat protein
MRSTLKHLISGVRAVLSLVLLVIWFGLGWIAPAWASHPEANALALAADPAATSAIEQTPNTPSAKSLLQKGITVFQEGDYLTAIEQFNQAIAADPGYAAAYSNRCLSHIHLDEYTAAIADCTEAVRLNAADTEAYLNRGLAYYRLGKPTEAIADYTQLLQFKPHDFRAYYNRGLAQAEQQAYREAIVDYGEALRQVNPLDHSTLAEIHNDRGLAQLWLEHWPQAVAEFTQAVQFSSSDIRAYYNRGCAYHHQGNSVAAIADFTQVLQIAPDHAPAYLSRGLIQQQLGNTAAALVDLKQAAQHFCDHGQLLAYQQTLSLIEKLQVSAIG